MRKKLLKSVEDFKSLEKANIGMTGMGWTTSIAEDPEQYPCVALWWVEDDSNGPAHFDAEYVYLDDFNA